MPTSFRPQRLLQRLSLSGPARRPRTTSSVARGACIACQLRSQSQSSSRPTSRLPDTRHLTSPLRRRFASTSPASNDSGAPAGPESRGIAPDITNHYTIFRQTLPSGPPPGSPFDISLGDLRREFLQLQNVSHPDKYPPGEAKRRAEAFSTLINEAYRTLADPLLRAQYLLREMHGIDVTAEDGAAKHALDAQTLMEVMEVQETIEEVSADPNAEAKIAELKKENAVRVESGVRELAGAFDREDIETARTECVRLRFWYNVGEALKEWEPGMTELRLVH
ncbi:Co-chaperone Hsc20 [Aspergillus steynii IBT 23096]|uniref:Co-chaperone Hsc20 n=1 Tax=Aspergillus steynii IBT 23096 TaxID=1392250 RepID=A0A2I2FVV0_9EURO|nr:Co-chaperone Hsc20 [Aspergillus steynii IBT 23096]PLB44760.1 Co-chaperone Hsc20 [Aspergillus steynii IBT 23096]